MIFVGPNSWSFLGHRLESLTSEQNKNTLAAMMRLGLQDFQKMVIYSGFKIGAKTKVVIGDASKAEEQGNAQLLKLALSGLYDQNGMAALRNGQGCNGLNKGGILAPFFLGFNK